MPLVATQETTARVPAHTASLLTCNAAFARRLRDELPGGAEIALNIGGAPESVRSVHRLACDCAAEVLIVDVRLFEAGRVLAGDPEEGKSFHLLLAFPCIDATAADAALHTHAHGCIDFDIPARQLLHAIATVANGELWFPRWMVQSFYERALAAVDADATSPDRPDADVALTHRELEVMHFVRRGLTNKEIGREMSISPNTVKKHVHSALGKLGLIHRRQTF